MNFQMNKTHHTRAKHLMRAWGEYKRWEWPLTKQNGMQRSSVFRRTAGDMAEFNDATLERTREAMLKYRDHDYDRYKLACAFYIDRVSVPKEKKAMQRFYYSLKKIHEFVFHYVHPEIIAEELKHHDRLERERRLDIAEYDWNEEQIITTGKEKRALQKVIVNR